MAQPPRYDRTKDFTEDYGDNTDHAALNAELDGVSQSINTTRDNLALIQRDDGELANDIVTADSLSAGLKDEIIEVVGVGIDDRVQEAQAAAAEAVNAAALSGDAAVASGASAGQSATSAASAQANAQAADSSRADAVAAAAAALANKNATDTNAAAALASADAAATSEVGAGQSAAAALVNKNASDINAASALASKSAAAVSEGNAADSEAAAAISETNAKASELLAKSYAEATQEDISWLGTPIGGYITPFEAPPTDDPRFRYVLCTAGQTGAGGYNEGVLTDETITGTAPLLYATATVSIAGSPMDGATIHLINTEGRFVGAGESEALEDDTSQGHFHGMPTGFSLLKTNIGAAGQGSYVGTSDLSATVTGPITDGVNGTPRISNKNQPRAHRLPHYRRIK